MAKKYLTFSNGWLKNGKNGDQYISAAVNTKEGYSLVLRDSKGEEVQVTNFACFFNETKKSPNGPDTRFVVTLEE